VLFLSDDSTKEASFTVMEHECIIIEIFELIFVTNRPI
jgi:hypothetical protein